MSKLTFVLHQPPRTTVKSYIEHLNKLTEVAVSKSARGRSAKTKTVYEPLEIQIARWWANLPEAMKDRSFQITEIAGVCGGKSLERPALRNVAAALRALGWKEYRDWTTTGRNRRFWIPSLPRWCRLHHAPDSIEQFEHWYSKCGCNYFKSVKSWIRLTVLNSAQVGLVKTTPLSEHDLAHSRFLPQRANYLPKIDSCRWLHCVTISFIF